MKTISRSDIKKAVLEFNEITGKVCTNAEVEKQVDERIAGIAEQGKAKEAKKQERAEWLAANSRGGKYARFNP